MKKVAILTLGCKINTYESACIIDSFVKENYRIVDFNDKADIYIINSCTVTARTDYKSRNAIRRAIKRKEKNNNIKVVATGCYVQRNFQSTNNLDVDLIVDNNKKSEIIKLIKNLDNKFDDILESTRFDEYKTEIMPCNSRAFVKIQDGCDFFCSYCAIPYARGKSRSRNVEDVIEQINILTKNGYKEVVIGGINLGLYGRDLGESFTLCKILEKIEKQTDIEQIRLSSIEPQLFDDKLLNYIKSSKKICPHFHIPLQVGNDFLLKKMNRRYSTKLFRELIENLNNTFSKVAIGVDVIVGLPGESELFFQDTYDFLKSLSITSLHVFSYSRRYNTKADKMTEQNSKIVKNIRSKLLSELSNNKSQKFLEDVLREKTIMKGVVEMSASNFYTSLTNIGIKVYFNGDNIIEKNIYKFYPIELYEDGLKVELID